MIRCKNNLDIEIRPFSNKNDNLVRVLLIDKSGYEYPWVEADFKKIKRQHGQFLIAIDTYTDEIVGFICYKLRREGVYIVRLAVHPDFRRMGVAKKIFNSILMEMARINFSAPE